MSKEAKLLKDELNSKIENFIRVILENEKSFFDENKSTENNQLKEDNNQIKKEQQLKKRLLENFLLSFGSRTATRERLHIFTTNYDRFIEYGLDEAGLLTIDRLSEKLIQLCVFINWNLIIIIILLELEANQDM